MRVKWRKWCRAASVLALLHLAAGGCSSSQQQQQLDELGTQEDLTNLQQEGNFSNLEENAVSDFNGEEGNFAGGEGGDNFAGEDNFGGNSFNNLEGGNNFGGGEGNGFDNGLGNEGFNNGGFNNGGFNNEGFGGNNFGGDQFADNPGMQGGEGDLQDIIEEMNQANTDQFNQGGDMNSMGGMDNSGMMAGDQMAPMDGGMEGMNGGMQGMDGGMDSGMGAQQGMATAGSPVAPGLPEIGSKMSYIVQKGDTLVKIAARIYGDPNRWTEIANFTGLANPRLIYPGDVVYYQLTEQSKPFAAAYASVTRSEVEIMEGDTLSSIASRVLGSPSNWKLIWRQNDTIDNPDRLAAGTKIYYVEPGSLSAAVDSFQDQFAATGPENSQVLMTETQQEPNQDSKVDQSVMAGSDFEQDQPIDVEPVEFIQAEFGSSFVQIDNGQYFKRMI